MLLSILDDGTLDINYTKPTKTINATNFNPNVYNSNNDNIEEDWYLRTFFNDSIIIMTSNIWNDRINNEISWKWIWFNLSETNVEDLDMEQIILEEFWKQFKIEMQWRFDYVVPFNHLSIHDAEKIIDQVINRLITITLSSPDWFLIEFSSKVKINILNSIVTSQDFKKYWWRYIEWYFKKNIIPYIARAKNSWNFCNNQKQYCLLVTEKDLKIVFSKVEVINKCTTKNKVKKLLEI